MQFRKFGKLDWQVSALGFGAMRMPTLANGEIDESEAIKMIRTAIDGGVNYVDTAYSYHNGLSEVLVGKALQDGYRQKTRIATKMPSWLSKTPADLDRLFNEQLERLQVEKIDFYLLHAMNANYWKNYQQLNIFDWAENKKVAGQIGCLGFSFHDNFMVFEQILNGYDAWDFCQIQYNYMDTEYQAGERGLKAAAEKGLGVIIMEPLRGGALTKLPLPKPVEEVMRTNPRDWSPAEWAFQWIWDQPEVSLVLSGMSTLEQVQQNLLSASRSGIGSLSLQDKTFIEQVKQAYLSLNSIPCTGCGYCQPCPNDVLIPEIFALYNDALKYDEKTMVYGPGNPHWAYNNNIKPHHQANNCVECGLCEEACPQSIEIIDWLKEAHLRFAPPQGN